MLDVLNLCLSNALFWFLLGITIAIGSFLIDLIDHGFFIATPAFMMIVISPWIEPIIFNLLIYAVMIALFYYFCQSHRDWLHGSKGDINDEQNDP